MIKSTMCDDRTSTEHTKLLYKLLACGDGNVRVEYVALCVKQVAECLKAMGGTMKMMMMMRFFAKSQHVPSDVSTSFDV